jgi:protein PhnA
MAISNQLKERCNGTCELCGNLPAEHEYTVSPKNTDMLENQVAVCNDCLMAMDEKDKSKHWRCLEGSIWNPEPPVQALSYRLLYAYKDEDWANSVIGSIELDEDIVQWALSTYEVAAVHKDAYGNILENGDNVVLNQALNVKGTSFTAAKGTVVKRIRLVPDNVEQIEGKINEQVIVILCKYVKKG